MKPTDDLRVKGYSPLIVPSALKQEIPISEKAAATVTNGRKSIENIIMRTHKI